MQPEHIGVDETSFRKRHDYVTVASDRNRVLYVSDDHRWGWPNVYSPTIFNVGDLPDNGFHDLSQVVNFDPTVVCGDATFLAS